MREFRVMFGVSLFVLTLFACEEKTETGSSSAKEQPVEAKQAGQPPEKVAPKDEELVPPPWADRIVASSGFPCDVEQVLATSCRRCHWDPQENDAPFPLVKWENTQAIRSEKPIHVLMKQMVAADLMPPLDALVDPEVKPLSEEHKKVILAWLDAGAKKSEEICK